MFQDLSRKAHVGNLGFSNPTISIFLEVVSELTERQVKTTKIIGEVRTELVSGCSAGRFSGTASSALAFAD